MSRTEIAAMTITKCDRCESNTSDNPSDWSGFGRNIRGETTVTAMDGASAGGPPIGPMDLCGPCLTDWRKWLSNPSPVFLDVSFDGGPGPVGGRFIDVEMPEGKSVGLDLKGASEWIEPADGGNNWRLRFRVAP